MMNNNEPSITFSGVEIKMLKHVFFCAEDALKEKIKVAETEFEDAERYLRFLSDLEKEMDHLKNILFRI